MVVHQNVEAHSLAVQFAQQLSEEPAVRELWLHESPEIIDIWIIAGSIDDETELKLYAKAGNLYEQFRMRRLRLHVLHPAMFTDGTDLCSLVARGSKRIAIQP